MLEGELLKIIRHLQQRAAEKITEQFPAVVLAMKPQAQVIHVAEENRPDVEEHLFPHVREDSIPRVPDQHAPKIDANRYSPINVPSRCQRWLSVIPVARMIWSMRYLAEWFGK